MADAETIGESLRENITRFLVPLQTQRMIDRHAFAALIESARSLATELRGSALVPKHLLNEMYVASNVVRAEAPYFKGESAALEQMAGEIEMVFSLILRDESPNERIPGTPRII